MSKKTPPYDELEKIFHEPSRLAILSNLCGAAAGITFVDLKEKCSLTDGNLSRHLQTLENKSLIKIKKDFVKSKPQTTIYLSGKGRRSFMRYLEALEEVLETAARKAKKAGISNELRLGRKASPRSSQA